jgi:uncharacterized membrane protein YgaE (UPF0421/DUF939 family)
LGNLVILPPNINSKVQDKSFEKKKEIYQQHRQLKILDEIIKENDWDLEAIKKREEKLIEWAKKEWS